MVELAKIQKPETIKDIVLTVRTTKQDKEWLDKNNISPSLLFEEAIKDIKEKLKKNVNRKNCVVCGEPSKLLKIGLGMETSSFCSEKCMKIYTSKEENKNNLDVKGMRVFVK
jgi:predicted nucleic acid-binding Zn ribbon protein